MSLIVRAPVTGTVRQLAEVPDPIFAQEMVGSGVVIDPIADEPFAVFSPLTGRVLTLHPHAAVILSEDDGPTTSDEAAVASGEARRRGVLVHIGIDTVKLKGRGFTVHVRAGESVVAGQPLVTVEPAVAREAGYSLLVPVIAMEAVSGVLDHRAIDGAAIAAGDQLYTWL